MFNVKIPMKKSVLFFITFIQLFRLGAQDTFSICAIDSVTGEIGSAGASCVGAPQAPDGARIISMVVPGKGAVHIQAAYLDQNKNYAGILLKKNYTAQQIIDSLVTYDAQRNPANRKYGAVKLYANNVQTAAYTGASCPTYKGHIKGIYYSIQGNTLLGKKVLDSMEARFIREKGDLACKLMAAMQGSKMVGADNR